MTMPARDVYHGACQAALIKDGWTITDDPLRLEYGGKKLYVDLGAEEVLAAEKPGQKIAVEIKCFLGPSDLTDLQRALGQFVL
jgi:XisH protein